MKRKTKFIAFFLCMLMLLGTTTAFAADKRGRDDEDTKSDKIWLVDGDHDSGEIESDEIASDAKQVGYRIRLHYENGNTKEITGKVAVGAELPWMAEKVSYREYNGKNYVLSGVKAVNYVSGKADANVADLYYRLDVNENDVPDRLQDSKTEKDYKFVYVYANSEDTTTTVESVLRGQTVGTMALNAIDLTRVLPDDDNTYRLVSIDAESAFVTADAAKNVATLCYESVVTASDEAEEDTVVSGDKWVDNGVCPINGQPSWICNGTHDHDKMMAELKNKPVVNESSDLNMGSGEASGQIAGDGYDENDPVLWCTVHNQPSWICNGQHN